MNPDAPKPPGSDVSVHEQPASKPAVSRAAPILPFAWKPGQSGNPTGAKPKQTLIDLLRMKVDEEQAAIVAGLLAQAKKGNVKAFAEIRDTLFGVPKQAIEVSRPDDPQAELMHQLASILGLVPPATYIEGEARELET